MACAYPQSTSCAASLLTQVDEAHHRVGLADHRAQRWRVRAEGRRGCVVDLSQPFRRSKLPHARSVYNNLIAFILPIGRHGVVQVQHEERRGGGRS